MKEVTLHQQEQARLHVLNSVLAQEITIGQAAALMDLSERHTRRLLAAYRKRGAEALAHGNRGRRPHNAVPETVAAEVVQLAADRYPGANHTHFTELIEEQQGIALSRPTVRRILMRAGLPSPKRRRPPAHRARRERMPREGMLLQVDGSHHAWLEQRAPRFALLLAVDDATGSVPHALFRPAEDARGYFLLMEQVLRRSGRRSRSTATATPSSAPPPRSVTAPPSSRGRWRNWGSA
jgi:transposase